MKITKDILKRFETVIENWVPDEKDPHDLRKVYTDDRRTMRGVLKAIQDGNLKLAAKRMANMDTILRDNIPQDLYDILSENYWEKL